MLNVSAKIVADGVKRERTALLQADVPSWCCLLDIFLVELSIVQFLNKAL